MLLKLKYLETDKDIGDKYVQLSADYRALVRKYDQQVRCILQSRALFRASDFCKVGQMQYKCCACEVEISRNKEGRY